MFKMKLVADGIYGWGPTRSVEGYASLGTESRELFELDLATCSGSEIKRRLHAFAAGYVTRQIGFAPGRTLTAFRASRPCSEVRSETWNKLCDLGAPRPEHVQQWGRFNAPRKPVLYMSSDPFTALAEARSKADEFRVVLVLRRQPSSSPFMVSQLGTERIPQYGFWGKAMGPLAGGLPADPYLQSYVQAREIAIPWRMQNNLLTEITTSLYDGPDDASKYRLTYYLGEQLQSIRNTVGFYYPSMLVDAKGINLVMPINIANFHLQEQEAWLVRLGSNPIFVPHIPTDPREPVVVRRGTFDRSGNVLWGEDGLWPLHALHRTFAPHPDFDFDHE